MRSDGFTLIWALILGALLLVIALAMVQSAGAVSRSASSLTRGRVLDVQEHNLLGYEQRLLEANAAQLIRTLPSPDSGAVALQQTLQPQLDRWCTRDPDGRGTNRLRVYASTQACGQGLPVATPTTPQLSTDNGLTTATFPLALVAPVAGRPGVHTANLSAIYGAASAGIYGLILPGDFRFPASLHVQGNVQVNGRLSFDTAPDVSGILGTSSCTAVADGCQGNASITVRSSTVPVMSLTPSVGHPLGMLGTMVTSTVGEVAAAPNVAGLTLTADRIVLGVMGDGSQYIKSCLGSLCTEYVGRADGNLYRLDTGDLVIAAWSGVLGVTSPGAVQLSPLNADTVSIARALSLITANPLTVTGNLSYVQTSCSKDLCNAAGTTATFGLFASTVTVASEARRLHAHVVTSQFNCATVTIFGSLNGTPQNSGTLNIQADERALEGIVPPGLGTLAARWRLAHVSFNP